jgi:hypothetical protein
LNPPLNQVCFVATFTHYVNPRTIAIKFPISAKINQGIGSKIMTQTMKMSRPMGVTILAVLQILVGLGSLLMGAGSVMLLGMVGASATTSAQASGVFGVISGAVGILFTVMAVISFILAWGYLTGRSWARKVGIVFAVLDGLYGLTSLPSGLLSVAIAVLMVYYLTRPAVIEWFSPVQNTVSPVTAV